MENNRNNQQSDFENNLQEILTNVLNQHIGDGVYNRPAPEQFGTEPIYSRRSTNTARNIPEVIDTLLNNLHTSYRDYHTNMASYLTCLNSTITLLHSYNNSSRETNIPHARSNRERNHNIPFYNNMHIPRARSSSPLSRPYFTDHPRATNGNPNIARSYGRTDNAPISLNIDIYDSIYRNFFNENVEVRPTEEQIMNASDILAYDPSMNIINHSCPISLEDFRPGTNICRIRYCGHCFTEPAFRIWFNMNVRCPVCRYDIRDDELGSSVANDSDTGVNETIPNMEGEEDEPINTNANIPSSNETRFLFDANQYESIDNSLNVFFRSLNTLFSGNENDLFNVLNNSSHNIADPSYNLSFHLNLPMHPFSQYDTSYNLASGFN
jgi:hypothetical protein